MTKLFRSVLAPLALSFSVLVAAAPAFAGDQKGEKHAKAPAASLDAKFERWLLTPNGKIDGMLLDGGRVVRLHDKSVKDSSLKSGDALHVDAKGKGTAFHRAKITKNGVVVVDDTAKQEKGKHEKPDTSKLSDVSGNGKIVAVLQGLGGKIHGVVLADGTTPYAHHKTALGSFNLKVGDAVAVNGKGGSYTLGRALIIDTIKLPNGETKKL
ncbi:MAG: hypothetical protein ACXVEE_05310 [Polyangiales bacterium]